MFKSLLASLILTTPALAEGITGADLLVDLDKYVGQSVRLNDGHVSMAQNDGAVVKSRGATFRISSQGIDRETFRYILSNCSGIMTGPACNLSLIVTPTTGKYVDWPILINVSRTEPPPA
jgi:hypothetical protein